VVRGVLGFSVTSPLMRERIGRLVLYDNGISDTGNEHQQSKAQPWIPRTTHPLASYSTELRGSFIVRSSDKINFSTDS
jgi:hypothetical protein